MGKCNSKAKLNVEENTNLLNGLPKNNSPNNAYGIKYFGVPIIPTQEITSPLKFDFRLSDIKVKMLLENQFYILQVIFPINNVFTLPPVEGTTLKFNFEHKLRLDIPYNQMENIYMELRLYSLPTTIDQSKLEQVEEMILHSAKLYSSIKIDLLTIAVGPEHHNIVLLDAKTGSKQVGRISYNISCNQIEYISLAIQTVKISISQLVQSDIAIKFQLRNSNSSLIETHFTDRIFPYPISKEEITVYEWNIIDSKELMLCTLSSMLDLRSSEANIHLFSLRFIDIEDVGWSEDEDAEYCIQKTGSGNDIKTITKYNLVGSSNLNFYRILSENDNMILKQSSKILKGLSASSKDLKSSRKKQSEKSLQGDTSLQFRVLDDITQTFKEDIFFNSAPIGKLEVTVAISNIPLVRQIMCGVLTERGFDISSNYLIENNLSHSTQKFLSKNETMPNEIKQLLCQRMSLETEISKHARMNIKNAEPDNNLSIKILNILTDIKATLLKSKKESCLDFGYVNNKDLYKAQKEMLELGGKILDMIEKLDHYQRVIGFDVLKAIHDRAEFDLGTISRSWFKDSTSKQGIQYSTFQDKTLLKKKIIERMIVFNNNCLKFSLERLSSGRNSDKESKTYVEYFLSMAYFRLPVFRNCFLKMISPGPQKVSSQSSRTIHQLIEVDPVNSLLLWDNSFFLRLESAVENTKIKNQIREKMGETERILSAKPENDIGWGERLAKRDSAFVSMVRQLERYIQSKLVRTIDIKWYNIPGFDIIISALSYELRVREIRSLPGPLMDLLPIFVNNSAVTNDFVRIMFERTNVYDVNAVYNLVRVVDSLFSEHYKKKDCNVSNLAQTFDYTLLIQALKAVIKIDHALLVSRFIWLYYRNAHSMSIQHIEEVCGILIDENFYNLFFHWSWQVRNLYFYLIRFILCHRITDDSKTKEKKYWQRLGHEFTTSLKEKMAILPFIQKAIYLDNLDPTFNSEFDQNKFEEFQVLPKNVLKNVVVGMQHFEKIDNIFKGWELLNKDINITEIEYPDVRIIFPRDDVVDYSPESW